MQLKIISIAAFLGFLTATSTTAGVEQTNEFEDQTFSEGLSAAPRGSFYFGGYSASEDFVRYRVHFFERRVTPESELGVFVPWALRLSANPASEPKWVDGQSCPAIYGVMQAVTDYATPRVRSPKFHQLPRGARTPPGPPIPLESSRVSLWAFATFADRSSGQLEFSATSGSLESLVSFAESELDSCWTSSPPVGVFPAS